MNKIRRILVISALYLLFTGTLSAQEKSLFAGFRYGLSLPMGQFASHEFKRDGSEYGGYAMLGTNFSAEAGWQFYKGFGAGINISTGYYPVAVGWYLLDKIADDPFAQHMEMKTSPFIVRNYTAGMFYTAKVWKNFTVMAKSMAGICWSSSPDQFYGADYYGVEPFYWHKTSAQSKRFTFLGGVAINYQLFKNVQLLIDSEFSYTRSKFTFWKAGSYVDQYMNMPLLHVRPGINITF